MKKHPAYIAAALMALIGCQAEQVTTDPGPVSCQQRIRIDVWSDLDGDGEFDPDEPPLENVLVMVVPEDDPTTGGIQARTGADGKAYVAGFELENCSPEGYDAIFPRQVAGHAFPDNPAVDLDGFDMASDSVSFGLPPQ